MFGPVMRMRRIAMVAAVFISISFLVGQTRAVERPARYYVGEKKCRACHGGYAADSSFNVWRLSAHARAYSVLTLPEAFDIAELSGISVHPQKSPVCLGCHTTAPTSEDWELDEGVHREDGVQCEACHGPGSEYMFSEIKKNPQKAMEAGLLMPVEEDCMVCHIEKGTHVAIVKSKKFDFKTAMAGIAHPAKLYARSGGAREERTAEPKKRHYTGVWGCAACHKNTAIGDQLSAWRRTEHARAYAVLSTVKPGAGPESLCQFARDRGVPEKPQAAHECLRCHTTGAGAAKDMFGPLFDIVDGVQCESCHGAGSEFAFEAVMLDPLAAADAGLLPVGEKPCRKCHIEDKFDYSSMLEKIAHPRKTQTKTASLQYKTPFNLCLNRDGTRLYIACEESNSLIVADTVSRRIIAEIPVGLQPHDVCLPPDETRVYVTNRMDDTLSIIDTASHKIIATVPTGDEPHGVITDASGETIYIANYGTADISVIDAQSLRLLKRLAAGRGTWALCRSPDGRHIYATNNLSHFIEFRTPSQSEVTVIDTARKIVVDRRLLVEANLLQGIDFSPDGEFALVTALRTKNLVPMTRIAQGWTITNGLGILWKDGRIDQLLLDEVNSYFADPTDVVITPDGRFAYVTGGGIDAAAVIDLQAMKDLLARLSERERRDILPNHLGYPVEYVMKRIPVGKSPRGMAVSPDSRFVYVANGLGDSVSVIDVEKQEVAGTIDLEGPGEITLARKGSILFHNAGITFQTQFSCHSCHPDGNVDGITYDIEPDGIGRNPVDNRTLRGILDTAPFKWEGTNPSLQRQCGPRLAVFFTRIDPFTNEQLEALDHYICTIPRPPNRFRALGEDLSPAQARGKVMFERTVDNIGRPISKENRCNFCHSGAYFTNRQRFNVETQSPMDDDGIFDVPHLNNIYETAPYLHDGRSATLEEIWTRFNPNDKHGVTNDMTKDQLNDLVEYLKTL